MTPSRVRAELLGEHFELRRLIEEARALLRSGGDPAPGVLQGCMDRLANALHAHSKHEEDALTQVFSELAKKTAGGEPGMDESHIAEHARLVGVVREACASPDAVDPLVPVVAVLSELESHMNDEEAVLLSEDLLSDE